MGILDHFSGTPRGGQKHVLLEIEKYWKHADVFVVGAPVASGKSRIAHCISVWAHKEQKQKSLITTPNNLLVEQYKKEFSRLHVLRKKSSYTCTNCSPEDKEIAEEKEVEITSCEDHHRYLGYHCENCPYLKAVKQTHVIPYKLSNIHTMLAHRLYSDVTIFDEAHNVIDFIREANGKRLWAKDYGFPTWINTYGKLLAWLEKQHNKDTDPKLKLLYEELSTGKEHFLISRSLEMYRGREEDCISLLPLVVGDAKPILWPEKKVKKIIMLSATIGPADIKALGLDKRRVVYIDCPSPIPKERRPFTYSPVGKVSYSQIELMADKLAKKIQEIATSHPEEKGIVHAPYSLAKLLKLKLTGSRFLFHEQYNKTQQFKQFCEDQTTFPVLVCSGMHEGIDLPYDAARWQVICKVPYPSLAEPAIKYQADESPDQYAWETIKILSQAYGRVCRTPDDFGVTYCLDSNFEVLFNKWKHLFPIWLKEVIQCLDGNSSILKSS